jgi:hypothetical protein
MTNNALHNDLQMLTVIEGRLAIRHYKKILFQTLLILELIYLLYFMNNNFQ